MVDALIAEAIKASTLEEMATACRALDRVLLWGFYQIPLDAIAPARIVYWNKFGRPEREDLAVYDLRFPTAGGTMTQKRRGSRSTNRKGVILSVAKNPGLDYPKTQILRLRLRMTFPGHSERSEESRP